MLDYLEKANRNIYPAYFSAYEMNATATEKGNFTIIGYLNKDNEEYTEFTLHLTFPPFHKMRYILPKSKTDHIYITCQLDSSTPSFIFIEQPVIRNRLVEVFAVPLFLDGKYLFGLLKKQYLMKMLRQKRMLVCLSDK